MLRALALLTFGVPLAHSFTFGVPVQRPVIRGQTFACAADEGGSKASIAAEKRAIANEAAQLSAKTIATRARRLRCVN